MTYPPTPDFNAEQGKGSSSDTSSTMLRTAPSVSRAPRSSSLVPTMDDPNSSNHGTKRARGSVTSKQNESPRANKDGQGYKGGDDRRTSGSGQLSFKDRDEQLVRDCTQGLAAINSVVKDYLVLSREKNDFDYLQSQLTESSKEKNDLLLQLQQTKEELEKERNQLKQTRDHLHKREETINSYITGNDSLRAKLQETRNSVAEQVAKEKSALLKSPENAKDVDYRLKQSFKMGFFTCINEMKDVASISRGTADSIISRLPPCIQEVKVPKDPDNYRLANLCYRPC